MTDMIFSMVTLCFSIYLLMESSKLPKGIANMPGPNFFPSIVAWVILILSCVIFFNGAWKVFKRKDQKILQGQWVRTLTIIFCVLIYVLLWGKGNFLINTWLLLFFIQIITKSSWYYALIGSTVLDLSVYFLFGKIFHVILF